MSIESTVLGTVFDFDNWFKYTWCCELNYPSLTSEYDVVYSQSNPQFCKCDLHYNKDSRKYAKYPVLMNIHGGGWIIGDKKNSKGFSMQVADAGVFVVNINYGLPPKTSPLFEKNNPKASHSADYVFPYPIKNCFDALQWIKENADKYNLDIDNVFVSGDSAGANMAGVVAAANSNPEYAEAMGITNADCIKLKGSMLYCGFYDCDTFNGLPMNKIPVARSMMQEWIGMQDPTQSPMYKYVNPIPYMTVNMPRTLVVSGMLDIMTTGQSDMVSAKLNELGVDHAAYKGRSVPNSFHDFLLLSFTNEAKKCMKFSTDFIDETVKK